MPESLIIQTAQILDAEAFASVEEWRIRWTGTFGVLVTGPFDEEVHLVIERFVRESYDSMRERRETALAMAKTIDRLYMEKRKIRLW